MTMLFRIAESEIKVIHTYIIHTYPTLPVSFGGDLLKTFGPFYVVSMPGEVKDLTQEVN